jgi:hypothetical protein
MRLLLPMVYAQQHERARAHVQGAVEHTLGPIAGDGDADLWPQATVAARSRWGFRHDRLVPHQEHRPLAPSEATFEPPLACRHVDGRRAKV